VTISNIHRRGRDNRRRPRQQFFHCGEQQHVVKCCWFSPANGGHGPDGFTISKGCDLLRSAFGLFAAVRNRTAVTAHRQQKRTDEARRQFRPPYGLRWPLISICRPHSMSNEYLSFCSRPSLISAADVFVAFRRRKEPAAKWAGLLR
jgi:hypothetical protein